MSGKEKTTRSVISITSRLIFAIFVSPTLVATLKYFDVQIFVHRKWSSKLIKWLEENRKEKVTDNVAFKVHLQEIFHNSRITVEMNRGTSALAQTQEYGINTQLLKDRIGDQHTHSHNVSHGAL